MSADPDFQKSADAWLDASGSESERRLLREILREHPDAALDLAVLARGHAVLQSAGLSECQRLQRASRLLQPSTGFRFRGVVSAPVFRRGAVAAILLTGSLLWYALTYQGEQSPVKPPSRHVLTAQHPLPPPLARISQPLDELAPPDAAFAQRLSRFIIPDFSAKNVSLAKALDTLSRSVRGLDPALALSFKAGDALPEDLTVNLHVRYQSAEMLVRLISVQTGTRIQLSGREHVVSLNPRTPPGTEMVTFRRSVRAFQDFHRRQGLEDPEDASSPTKGLDPANLDPAKIAAGLLEVMGEDSPATTLKEGMVELTLSDRSNFILSSLMYVGRENPPGTWAWTPTLLYLNTPASNAAFQRVMAGRDKATLTAAEWQNLLNETRGTPDAVLSGETKEIQAGEDKNLMFLLQGNETEALRVDLTNQPSGDSGGVRVKVAMQLPPPPDDTTRVYTTVWEYNGTAALEDGAAVVFGGLQTPSRGKFAVLVSGVRDPARPAPEVLPYGIPVPGQADQVYSPYAPDQGAIGVAGLGRGSRVKCPYTGKSFRVP